MATLFTPEIGNRALKLIHSKNWKVCYEHRHNGDANKFQSMETVYRQVATSLVDGPRYRVFPGSLDFDTFIRGATNDTLQLPRVTIEGELRILFGFGIRGDHCYFVTNARVDGASADRSPKDYEYMLGALITLEYFVDKG